MADVRDPLAPTDKWTSAPRLRVWMCPWVANFVNDVAIHEATSAISPTEPRQPFSPRDLILAAKWSSALFTTYSLSLSFFEAVPFSGMSKTIRDVTMLTDVAGYAASLSEVGAIDVGRNYEVVPVSVHGGVFHPKIAVLIERGGPVRAMVGSGNLTFGGWGYNTEVAEVLVPALTCAPIGDLADFLTQLANQTGPGQLFAASRRPNIDQYAEACRAMSQRPGLGATRLLHTLAGRLDKQIAEMAAELGGAVALTVVSPFFSAQHGVALLARTLDCDTVAVAMPPNVPTVFDFAAARAAGLHASPVICDLFNDNRRSLHAKAFDVECRRGRLLVSGSANATTAALLGHNVEAVVVRVAGLATSLGWRPTGTYRTAGSDGTGDDDRRPPCLAAHFDAGRITGLMFGIAAPGGDWQASLRYGTTTQQFGRPVTVDSGRLLRVHPGERSDHAVVRGSARPGKRPGGGQRLADAVRPTWRGPHERPGRPHDRQGIWRRGHACRPCRGARLHRALARKPNRGGQPAGRRPRGSASATHGAIGADDAERLVPLGAFEAQSRWTGDAGSVAFESLLDALVRHFATALPGGPDDEGEDEDEEPQPVRGRRPPPVRGDKPRTSRVSLALFSKAFEKMAELLAALPSGPARVPALYLLFDMIVGIAPHCDEPEALTFDCLRRWLTLAEGCREPGAPSTLSTDRLQPFWSSGRWSICVSRWRAIRSSRSGSAAYSTTRPYASLNPIRSASTSVVSLPMPLPKVGIPHGGR